MKTLQSLGLALIAGLVFQIEATAAGDPLEQWREVQIAGSTPNQVIRYAQGKWLGLKRDSASNVSRLVTSTNGRDWTTHTVFEPAESLTDLEFSDDLWLAVGTRQSTNVLVLTSTNGTDWSSALLPAGDAAFPSQWWRIGRSPQEWILVPGSMNSFFRSPDGRTWTASALGDPPIATQLSNSNALGIADIAYSDGHWVAAVNEYSELDGVGSLAISTNLIQWQWLRRSPLPGGRLFSCLKYAHGLWFGVGSSYWNACSGYTMVVSSTDATNWTYHLSTPAPGFPGLDLGGDITLADDRLLAIGVRFSCSLGGQAPFFESDPLISLQQHGPGEVVVTRAAGIPVVVEATDDFGQWHTLTNLPLGFPVQPFADATAASAPARFYRARTP